METQIRALEEENIKSGQNNLKRDFFSVKGVENCCFPHLKNTFDTLFLRKKVRQQDLAGYLGLDKGYISRMVNGKIIPPLRIRLKVGEFFGEDCSLIWREE